MLGSHGYHSKYFYSGFVNKEISRNMYPLVHVCMYHFDYLLFLLCKVHVEF